MAQSDNQCGGIDAAVKRLLDTDLVHVIQGEGTRYPTLVVPEGYKAVPLESAVYNEHSEFPERRVAIPVVTDAASFIEYWKLWEDDGSRAFADRDKGLIVGILDYHLPGSERKPRWGKHRVHLTLKKSAEWATWLKQNKEPMSQIDFATFIEDNAPDITVPNAATFVEIARDMRATADIQLQSKINPTSGATQFQFVDNTKATAGAQNVEVPDAFTISIPIYEGMAKIDIKARIRYRVSSGKLVLWYHLYRAEAMEREAFASVAGTIQTAIGRHVFMGTP